MSTRLRPKNQWLWHGMINIKFSKKCCRDCWQGHMSRSGWLSKDWVTKCRDIIFVLMGKGGTLSSNSGKELGLGPGKSDLQSRRSALHYLPGSFSPSCLSGLPCRHSSFALTLLLVDSQYLHIGTAPWWSAIDGSWSGPYFPSSCRYWRWAIYNLNPDWGPVPRRTRPSSKYNGPHTKSGTGEEPAMSSVVLI